MYIVWLSEGGQSMMFIFFPGGVIVTQEVLAFFSIKVATLSLPISYTIVNIIKIEWFFSAIGVHPTFKKPQNV